MLIATTVGVPTMNGMDTFYPPGHSLFSPLDEDYEERAYAFASRHGLLDGLCAFDLTKKTWRIVSAPPPAPRTHPFGAGLLDGDRILFSAHQPGATMLADGWSSPEDWGTWATGLRSTLTIKLQHDAFAASGAKIAFSASPYLPPGVSAKDVRVYLSDPPVSNRSNHDLYPHSRGPMAHAVYSRGRHSIRPPDYPDLQDGKILFPVAIESHGRTESPRFCAERIHCRRELLRRFPQIKPASPGRPVSRSGRRGRRSTISEKQNTRITRERSGAIRAQCRGGGRWGVRAGRPPFEARAAVDRRPVDEPGAEPPRERSKVDLLSRSYFRAILHRDGRRVVHTAVRRGGVEVVSPCAMS